MEHTVLGVCGIQKTSSTLQGFGLSFVGKCSWHFGPAKCCCWFSQHDNVQEAVQCTQWRVGFSE